MKEKKKQITISENEDDKVIRKEMQRTNKKT